MNCRSADEGEVDKEMVALRIEDRGLMKLNGQEKFGFKGLAKKLGRMTTMFVSVESGCFLYRS